MAKLERRTLRSDQLDLDLAGASAPLTGKTKKIDIPRDKFIRRIIIRQHGVLDLDDITAQPVPSIAPSLINHIRLIRDGSETILSADPARLMVMDYLEHGGQINHRIPHKAIGDNQSWQSTLVLDFMVDPNNPNEVFLYDESSGQIFTVMLPAMDYSSLKLELDFDTGLSDTGVAGLYDVAPTAISGATAFVDITLEEVFLENGDPTITRDNVYELRTIETQKQLGTSLVNTPYELTTGVLMRRLALFQDDATGGIGNPERPQQNAPLVDRFKLKQTSPISWTIVDEDFGSLQAQDLQEYNVRTLEMRSIAAGNVVEEDRDTGVALGFTVLDFDSGRDLVGALDLTGMKSGDIKLLMRTTGDATDSDYLYVLEHYLI